METDENRTRRDSIFHNVGETANVSVFGYGLTKHCTDLQS